MEWKLYKPLREFPWWLAGQKLPDGNCIGSYEQNTDWLIEQCGIFLIHSDSIPTGFWIIFWPRMCLMITRVSYINWVKNLNIDQHHQTHSPSLLFCLYKWPFWPHKTTSSNIWDQDRPIKDLHFFQKLWGDVATAGWGNSPWPVLCFLPMRKMSCGKLLPRVKGNWWTCRCGWGFWAVIPVDTPR